MLLMQLRSGPNVFQMFSTQTLDMTPPCPAMSDINLIQRWNYTGPTAFHYLTIFLAEPIGTAIYQNHIYANI